MTNLEHLMSDKRRLAEILYNNQEISNIFSEWYCKHKCKYSHCCSVVDDFDCYEYGAITDELADVIEWMDSEYQE